MVGISSKSTENVEKEAEVHSIGVNSIVPNPNQPRKEFSEDSIIKLADSIRQYGIIQPITVRKNGEIYEIVSGERRLRAAKELNMTHVPCIIVNINEEKSAEIAIIENLMREDLNIFEQATAIEALIDTYGLTQEQVAEKLSNSQSFVANKLRLLRLGGEEREIIIKNKLTERHARALLRINDLNKRRELLHTILKEGLNVGATESLIDRHINQMNAIKPEKSTTIKPQYKSVSSFYSALNRAVECAKASNIDIKSRKVVGDNFTEIIIYIPKEHTESAEQSDEALNVSRETS